MYKNQHDRFLILLLNMRTPVPLKITVCLASRKPRPHLGISCPENKGWELEPGTVKITSLYSPSNRIHAQIIKQKKWFIILLPEREKKKKKGILWHAVIGWILRWRTSKRIEASVPTTEFLCDAINTPNEAFSWTMQFYEDPRVPWNQTLLTANAAVCLIFFLSNQVTCSHLVKFQPQHITVVFFFFKIHVTARRERRNLQCLW